MRRSKRICFMFWVALSPRQHLRKSSAFVRWPKAPCSCSIFIRDRRDVSPNMSFAKLLSHRRTWRHEHGRKRCVRFRFVSLFPSARCLVALVFLAFFRTAYLLHRFLPSIPLDTYLFAYRRAFVFVFSSDEENKSPVFGRFARTSQQQLSPSEMDAKSSKLAFVIIFMIGFRSHVRKPLDPHCKSQLCFICCDFEVNSLPVLNVQPKG